MDDYMKLLGDCNPDAFAGSGDICEGQEKIRYYKKEPYFRFENTDEDRPISSEYIKKLENAAANYYNERSSCIILIIITILETMLGWTFIFGAFIHTILLCISSILILYTIPTTILDVIILKKHLNRILNNTCPHCGRLNTYANYCSNCKAAFQPVAKAGYSSIEYY